MKKTIITLGLLIFLAVINSFAQVSHGNQRNIYIKFRPFFGAFMPVIIGLLFFISDIQAQVPVIPGEMITIPEGNFLMGNDNGSWEERPQHSVYLPTYQIGKYEVTRGEYRKFIEAGGYSNPEYWSIEGWIWKEGNLIVYAGMYGRVDYAVRPDKDKKRTEPAYWAAEQEFIGHGYGHPRFIQTDNHPIVGVTYYEAEAYCKWAGGRLPTEAEYEKAARWTGTHSNIWPWGDVWDPEKSNNPDDHNPAGGGFKVNQSAPVGSYPKGASPYGCMDMVGNAYEWCADWAKSYPGSTKPYDYSCRFHNVKGGCWDDPQANSSYRSWYLPPSSAGVGPGDSDIIGFRMAKQITSRLMRGRIFFTFYNYQSQKYDPWLLLTLQMHLPV